MAQEKAQCRLDPISRYYLRDLAKIGVYGRGESAVMRRLVENGIRDALEKGLIAKRSIDDLNPPPSSAEESDQDDDG